MDIYFSLLNNDVMYEICYYSTTETIMNLYKALDEPIPIKIVDMLLDPFRCQICMIVYNMNVYICHICRLVICGDCSPNCDICKVDTCAKCYPKLFQCEYCPNRMCKECETQLYCKSCERLQYYCNCLRVGDLEPDYCCGCCDWLRMVMYVIIKLKWKLYGCIYKNMIRK